MARSSRILSGSCIISSDSSANETLQGSEAWPGPSFTHTVPSPHCTGWAHGVPILYHSDSPQIGKACSLPPGLCPCRSLCWEQPPLLSWLIPTHASEASTHVTSSRKPSLDILPPSYYVISPCPIAHPLLQLLADDLSSPLTL